MDNHEVLRELRNGLDHLYVRRLVSVVLFGSRARREARGDSDFDVLVVLRGPVDPNEEMRRVSPLTSALCLQHEVVISCVYVSDAEFQGEASPLLLNVRREGVAV